MKPDAPAPGSDRTAHFLRLIEASRGSRAAEVWYEFKTGKTATAERPTDQKVLLDFCAPWFKMGDKL